MAKQNKSSSIKGPSRSKAGPSVFQRAGKPGLSSVKRVPTQRVNLGGGARMTPQAGGPSAGGLAAAAATNRKSTGGWKNGKSPSGYEAAMHTYTGNPPANIGSSDIYR